MLIIIDGVDATGKTTLARALVHALGPGARYDHRGPPTAPTPLHEYEDSLAAYIPGSGEHIVIDRLHYSERVWPAVFGRPSAYTSTIHRHVELFLHARGALVIQAGGERLAVERRLCERGDDVLQVDRVAEALVRFRRVFAESTLPFLRHSVEAPLRPILAVQAAAELEVQAVTRLAFTTGQLGSPRPRVLLVGDRLSRSYPGDPIPGPPFPPLSHGYGSTLLQALEATWSALGPVAVVNAWDTVQDRRVDLKGLWTWLRKPLTIALGRQAAQHLARAGVSCQVVPHPRYHGAGAYGRELITATARSFPAP